MRSCQSMYVLRGELFDECCSRIQLNFVSKENNFVFPGTCGDRRFDVSGIDSEELRECQGSDIRLRLEPSLPFLCTLFRFETSLGCSLWCAVRIFESARRNPAALCFVFVNCHHYSFPFDCIGKVTSQMQTKFGKHAPSEYWA